MSDTIITVENLSKKYILSHKREQRYTAMRDVVADRVKELGKRLIGRGSPQKTQEEFWALKDINFEIKQGDRIGIIGRNGAGKSTLLKILSRITEPTTGRIHLKGRVASLLEVGTGFHPELTGRENIYLNGAIMGMSKVEIKKKFDEIVAFAEVEKFLDTPVKRYSSGMYVRLAFAVAAHLESEVLIVDEVLAVGDAHFQKKCLGKMEDVGKKGRTVIFVSHNMGLVQRLCNKGILLEQGSVQSEGDLEKIVILYNANLKKNTDMSNYQNEGNGLLNLTNFIYNPNIKKLAGKEVLDLNFIFTFNQSQETLNNELKFSIGIDNFNGSRVAHIENELINRTLLSNKKIFNLELNIDDCNLKEGEYRATIFVKCKNEIVLWIKDQIFFEVPCRDFWGNYKTLEGKASDIYLNYNMEINNA